MITISKQRFFNLTITVRTQQFVKLVDLAHEIPGVKVAQKTCISCSRMIQRRRQSRTTPRTATV